MLLKFIAKIKRFGSFQVNIGHKNCTNCKF